MPETPKKITGLVEVSSIILQEIKKEVKNIPTFKEKIEASLEKRVTEFLEIITGGTITLGASDIHIEALEEKAKIRTRIDGILQDILFIDKKTY